MKKKFVRSSGSLSYVEQRLPSVYVWENVGSADQIEAGPT